ncbi:MAG: acyltransferase family protein [Clostridiales bacterium]|nr:acyltransferase family protein [Clostridiales bacterium]
MENNTLRQSKVRNSSLELLRILCMFFIILHHYSLYGGYEEFTAENLTAGVVLVQMISMFGRNACSVFAMITGYFMIHSAKDTPKKSLILITEMVFYSWIINAILFATGQVEFTLRGLLIAVFPMIWGRNWFVLAYVIFLLFVPYVNRFIKALDKKTFTGLLALIFVFFSFLKTFAKAGWEFSDFDFFVVFYLAGAYIRLYADDLKYKNSINLIVMLISAALLLLTVPVMDFAGVITGIDTFVNMAVYFRDYYCPIGIVLAVSSFLFFKNIEFHSAVIN